MGDNNGKWFAIVMVAFFATLAIIAWSENRVDTINNLAEQYTDCVWKKYGQHPSAIYTQTGEYPVCNSNETLQHEEE